MLTISPLFEVVSPTLQNQPGDKSKWKKYILPAAGLAGAGLLGYGAYSWYNDPANIRRRDWISTNREINELRGDIMYYQNHDQNDKIKEVEKEIERLKDHYERNHMTPWHRGPDGHNYPRTEY